MPKRQRDEAQAIAEQRHVRMQSVDQPIGSLSGGNQQRAIFGRAFATEPRLLLLDEPTRGVDVGAKAEIYELIERAAADGMAVLVASSELEELQLICHRIAVMNHGRDRRRPRPHQDATKERIMTAAAGTAQVTAARAAVPTPRPRTEPDNERPEHLAPTSTPGHRRPPPRSARSALLRRLAESPEAGVVLACVVVFIAHRASTPRPTPASATSR